MRAPISKASVTHQDRDLAERAGQRLRAVPTRPRVLLRTVVGEELRRARTMQARTLRQVSDAAGVSIGHLSQVERGKAEASSEVLDALCRALGLDLASLLHAVLVDLTTTTTSGSPTRSRPHHQAASTPQVQAMAA